MSRHVEQSRVSLLYTQLRWLMRLRWVACAVIVVVGLLNWGLFGLYERSLLPIVAGLLLAAFNALMWWMDHKLPRLHERLVLLSTIASVHLVIDLGFLVVLTLWTGGVESPLIGFFMFHMVFASLLQPRTRAYLTAALTIATLAAGLWYTGQWPSTPRDSLAGIGWGITLIVTVYLANRITRAMYKREVARDRQNRRLRNLMDQLRTQHEVLVHQDKMAAMGQLAAGVAHEITNPLANMDSVLQLIQRNPKSPRPEMVSALREQVQRINRTVRQLTAFAHPGDGRLELVAVNDVVRASMEMLAYDRRLRNVKVETLLDESVGSTRMNPHATGQVLANLLRNALDAMEDVSDPRLVVRTRRSGDDYLIEITDTGGGILPEHQEKIFEPFFTTKSVGRGTGLGLSISVKLMREQGGKIEMTSQPGVGTSFVVRIPAIERRGAEAEENSSRGLEQAAQ